MSRLILALLLVGAPVAAWAYWNKDQGQGGAGDTNTDTAPSDAPATLDSPTFLETIGITDMNNTRGERNNNPGNIRKSAAPWQGKVQGTDTAFETFADPQSGIRALAKLLKNYQARGLNTVRKIIRTYAPDSENNTAAYIKAVAQKLNVSPDDVLTFSQDQLTTLVAAIIAHENGRVIYSSADISSAVSLA